MFTDAEMLGHLIHSFKFSCTGFSFNLRGHAIGEPYGKTKTTQQQQQKSINRITINIDINIEVTVDVYNQ